MFALHDMYIMCLCANDDIHNYLYYLLNTYIHLPTHFNALLPASLSGGPAKFLLGDYFKGKADAESSFVKEFGKDKSLIIKPAIVDGGTPGEIRPPGPPGVKAVDVEALAKVVVSGAVGDLSGVIDGNEDITSM